MPHVYYPDLKKYDSLGNLKITARLQDTEAVDAFGRLRISNPVSVFDTTNQYTTGSLLWEDVLTGGATVTHLPNESSVRLRCATASGDKVVRQSRNYHRYQPGKSQFVFSTFVLGAAASNVRRRVGYFDTQNGIFLEQTGSGLSVVQRSFVTGSAVDTAVAQTSWNLDQLTGAGGVANPSGITLDVAKSQIMAIDLQWLGVGRARIGFDIGGQIVYVHEFLNANTLSAVYMTTANLPVRYEIENLAAQGGNHDFIVICSGVSSEGGLEIERGYPFAVGLTLPNAVTTREPVLSIRPRTTFNSIVNRGLIMPRALLLGGNSDTPCFWELVYNGTLTGASFADVNTVNSITQVDTAATAITGGFTIACGYVNRQGDSQIEILSRLPLTIDIAGANPINLSVVGTSTAGAAGVLAALNWLEFR